MTNDNTEAAGTSEETRGFVERSPIAMGAISGPDFVWVMANDAYRRLTSRTHLLGRTLRDVFPEFEGQGVFDLVDRVRRTGEPVTVVDFRLHIAIDGVQQERFFDFSWFPSDERDDTGGARYIDIVVVDVTERRTAQVRAEQATREAERRYADVRDVVNVLQTALLTGDLPVVPELDLAACYLLAGEDQAAGGDWFDAVVRPDGRVALVVGDVVGHGVHAAAVMGQMKSALRDRLLGHEPIATILVGLDRFARNTDGASHTSVCVVEIDPATGDGEYCTAGHPPPMVVSSTGDVDALTPTGAPLLASSQSSSTYAVKQFALELDEVVLLYSDGLVERPGRTAAEGTAEAVDYVREAVAGRSFPLDPAERTVQRVTRRALEMLTRVSGHADDITMLAAQRTVPITPFRATVRPDASQVTPMRRDLADWLEAIDLDVASRLVLDHALSELVTNATTHAYQHLEPARDVTNGPTARGVDVNVDVDRFGVIHAEVRDAVRWRDPNGNGRGLEMVRRLTDTFEIDRDVSGTSARFTMQATHQADLLSSTTTPEPRPTDPEPPFTVDTDEDTVVVAGPVDHVNAALLAHEVRHASQGGARPVRVDLARVTHLGSAGIRALDTALESTDAVVLTTAPGSVAQHILDLVHLPHQIDESRTD